MAAGVYGSPLAKPVAQASAPPPSAGFGGFDSSGNFTGDTSTGGYTGPGTATTPPPAAPNAPPPTVDTGGGNTPDYGGLIQNDPTYVAAQSAAQQAQAAAAAQRSAAVKSAIIQYGGLPTGFTDTYGDADQATLDNAKQNQFSTLANLAKTYAQNQQTLRAQLAARGALQSGDLNYGEDQNQQAYGQQQYDAGNAFGGQYTNALNAYSGVLGTNAQNLVGAIQGAESNVQSNPAYQPVPSGSANYDAKSSAQYGQAIYVGPDGTLYDSTGKKYDPYAAAAAAAAAVSGTPGAGQGINF